MGLKPRPARLFQLPTPTLGPSSLIWSSISSARCLMVPPSKGGVADHVGGFPASAAPENLRNPQFRPTRVPMEYKGIR
jgi:hypothetical protein